MSFFVRTGSSRYEHHLVDKTFKFFKIQRTVLLRGRKTEAVIHKGGLACLVACIHTANLRNRDVRLVHDNQKIIREIFENRMRGTAEIMPCHVHGIILNAGADTGLAQHLNIKVGTFADSLCFNQLVLTLEIFHLLNHLIFDVLQGFFQFFFRYNIV